jgi:hypothetical protein
MLSGQKSKKPMKVTKIAKLPKFILENVVVYDIFLGFTFLTNCPENTKKLVKLKIALKN